MTKIGKKAKSFFVVFLALFTSCESSQGGKGLEIPFMKISEECYYLDEFLPTANKLITGKKAGYYIRYYIYENASFKNHENEKIMIGFFSKDNRCWSLFEEYIGK